MASGRILAEGVFRGFGFVLAARPGATSRVVVTAEHVIRGRQASQLEYVTASRHCIAIVDLDLAPDLDVAVLHLAEEVPGELLVADAAPNAAWKVMSQPKANDPVLTGTVTAERHQFSKGKNKSTTFVVQLHVQQEPGDYSGYSGSPVLSEQIPDAVIGVLFEQLPERGRQSADQTGQRRHASNVLYAVPIQEVIDRFNLSATRADRVPVARTGDTRPRVYISHWAAEPTARQSLETITVALQQAGFMVISNADRPQATVTLDRILLTEIGLAHAAVLLLSPAAMKSELIADEISILMGRFLIDDELQLDSISLVPVLVDVSREGIIEAPFTHSGIERLFKLQPPICDQPIATGEQVRKRLAHLQASELPDTALGKLSKVVDRMLQDVDSQSLINAADRLGISIPLGTPLETMRMQLATALWFSKPLEWERVVTDLSMIGNTNCKQLIDLIAPSWVDPRAARWMIEVTLRNAVYRSVVLNGSRPYFLSEMFVRRAYALSTSNEWVIDAGSTDDGATLSVQIEKIREQVKLLVLRSPTLPDEEFDEALSDELSKHPIYVAMSMTYHDQELLDALQEAFPMPTMAFFLSINPKYVQSGAIFTDRDSVRLQNAIYVTPSLRDGEEGTAFRQYYRLREL